MLKYPDESGFSLCLPPAYSWTPREGQEHQHRVRTRWGGQGRVNLIGTPSLRGGATEEQPLEYRLLEGPCRSGEVLGYLDLLAERAERGKANRSWWCWTTRAVPPSEGGPRRAAEVRGQGAQAVLFAVVLSAAEPRRGSVAQEAHQGLPNAQALRSLAELREAVSSALRLLGAVELQCWFGDT